MKGNAKSTETDIETNLLLLQAYTEKTKEFTKAAKAMDGG
jgi:hypothetical protein